MQYLLPCSCGRKLKVDSSDAGVSLACECGKSIEAPTLRDLKKLEAAPSVGPAVPVENPWGPRQGVIFLGVVVLLCGLAMTAILWFQRPVYYEPTLDMKKLHKSMQEKNLEQSFKEWQEITNTGLERTPAAPLVHYYAQLERNDRWLAVGLAGAATGVVMVVSALLSGSTRGRKKGKPAKT